MRGTDTKILFAWHQAETHSQPVVVLQIDLLRERGARRYRRKDLLQLTEL